MYAADLLSNVAASRSNAGLISEARKLLFIDDGQVCVDAMRENQAATP
jgi:hypothetical protein